MADIHDGMYDVELTEEFLRWRSRDVTFYKGPWAQLRKMVPEFDLKPFRVGDSGPDNPHLRAVVRMPVNATEHPMPIATVSPSYALAPHGEVAELCIKGLESCGVGAAEMKFEIGLSALSEWMNLRIQLPDQFSMTDKARHKTALRLECYNSVDGSSRLSIVFGWIRFICSNGLIIGKTMIEIRERHDGSLALDEIPGRIAKAFAIAEADRKFRLNLEQRPVDLPKLAEWIDGKLSDTWGKKAAARVYHICKTGCDVEFPDPFAAGTATEKPVLQGDHVRGSPERAATLYDVMQAMSYVAGSKTNANVQQKMLRGLDGLLGMLGRAA